jgi:hypothetical protein
MPTIQALGRPQPTPIGSGAAFNAAPPVREAHDSAYDVVSRTLATIRRRPPLDSGTALRRDLARPPAETGSLLRVRALWQANSTASKRMG